MNNEFNAILRGLPGLTAVPCPIPLIELFPPYILILYRLRRLPPDMPASNCSPTEP
jgi:hypothetical protein